MKRILAVLGPVAVLVVAAFAVDQAVHGGPQPPFPVAQSDQVAGRSVSGSRGEAVINVGAPEIRALRCRPSGSHPAGVDYLVVPVTVTVLRGAWDVDPATFRYAPEQKQSGTSAAAGEIGFGEDCDSLPAGTVEAGESSSGLVYFRVLATPGEITYHPRDGGQQEPVTFPVPGRR